MITNNHISVQRREKTTLSLQARIDEMAKIIRSGIIPEGFNYHKSDKRLMGWIDKSKGIAKIGVNTARDKYPLQWDELQKLRSNIKKLEDATKRVETQKDSKTKSGVLEKKKNAEKQIKILTNELITLRCAYLDLLDAVEEDKHKNTVVQEAIKRHHQHHSLQSIIRGEQ